MRRLLVLLAFACAEPEPLPTDAHSVAAMQLVRARLIGPAAARFRHVRTLPDSTVCGEVAGMNVMQEYTGWFAFRVTKGRAFLARVDADSLTVC